MTADTDTDSTDSEQREHYYERPGIVPNEKWPINWKVDSGNCSFSAGAVHVSRFFDDLPKADTRVSVGTNRASGQVTISNSLNHHDNELNELSGGVLANLNPEQAREIAAALELAAEVAEDEQPGFDQPDNAESGLLERVISLAKGRDSA